MTPLDGVRPPSPALTGRPGPLSRAAATAAAVAGVASVLVAFTPRPTSLVALALLVCFLTLPVAVPFARSRGWLMVAVFGSGALWGVALLGSGSGRPVAIGAFFVWWLVAALATFASVDHELLAERAPLGVLSAPVEARERAERVLNGTGILGVVALLAVLIMLLPALHLPLAGGGGASGGGAEGGGAGGSDGGTGSGRSEGGSGSGGSDGSGSQRDPFAPGDRRVTVEDYQYGDGYDPHPAPLAERARVGGVDPVVMRVRTEEALPLRGLAFDRWSGSGWTSSVALDRPGTQGTGTAPGEPDLVPSPGLDLATALRVHPERALTQEVIVDIEGSEVVFHSGELYSVSGPWRVSTRADGAAMFWPSLGAARYTVTSVRYPLDGGALPSLDATDARRHPVPAPAGVDYLQLPDLDRGVAELAAELRRDDRAAQIESVRRWLELNTVVDPWASGADQPRDPVADFLLDSKRASRDLATTSAIVLLRAQGVPARLGTGYERGVYDQATDTWTIRASDARAWVEVWFGREGGWQVFDVAAGIPLAPAPVPPTPREPFELPGWVVPVVLVAAVATGAGVWLRRRLVRRRELAARPWARVVLDTLDHEGAKRGRHRRPAQSVEAFAAQLSEVELPEPALMEVGAALSRELYSPLPPSPELRAHADAVLARAVAAGEARDAELKRQARAERRARRRRRLSRAALGDEHGPAGAPPAEHRGAGPRNGPLGPPPPSL